MTGYLLWYHGGPIANEKSMLIFFKHFTEVFEKLGLLGER